VAKASRDARPLQPCKSGQSPPHAGMGDHLAAEPEFNQEVGRNAILSEALHGILLTESKITISSGLLSRRDSKCLVPY